MGDNKYNYRVQHQQYERGWVPVYSYVIDLFLPNSKRVIKMSQAKLVFIVCDILGIPMTFLGIWFNIDNIKSAIIAILSIAYLSMRGYFFMVEKKQKVREKEIDIAKEEIELWNMQQDKIDRINNPKKSA